MKTTTRTSITGQKKIVLEELQKHGSITNIYAITELYVLRPATVINRLRGDGYKIETKLLHNGTAKYMYHGKAE